MSFARAIARDVEDLLSFRIFFGHTRAERLHCLHRFKANLVQLVQVRSNVSLRCSGNVWMSVSTFF